MMQGEKRPQDRKSRPFIQEGGEDPFPAVGETSRGEKVQGKEGKVFTCRMGRGGKTTKKGGEGIPSSSCTASGRASPTLRCAKKKKKKPLS